MVDILAGGLRALQNPRMPTWRLHLRVVDIVARWQKNYSAHCQRGAAALLGEAGY